MTCDIPNVFIKADMPKCKVGEDHVIMKISEDMLAQLDPDLYGPYVVHKEGRKVIYEL
jgi:hypothetical protein